MRQAIAAATLLTLVLALGIPNGARAQAVGETIDVQGWKIHLDKNDDGTHTCAAMWEFDDKSAVGFAADSEQRTFLIVSEPEAAMKKNRQYQVKYKVDKGKTKTAMGTATSADMIVIPIADPDTDYAAFGAGSTLTVDFGGDSYDETLKGSRDAIRALGRCIAGAPAK